MGDMADVFNDMREAKKAKRASNTHNSTDLLTRNKVSFQSKNGGAHLIVWAGNYDVDFWPSTGLWIVRGEKKRHGGVRSLVDFVKMQSR